MIGHGDGTDGEDKAAASGDPSLGLTHFDAQGKARMVDVGDKATTRRIGLASGRVRMRPETLATIRAGRAAKGDVLGVARVAGIMAAKRTSDLIPMCHPLLLTRVEIDFDTEAGPDLLGITGRVETRGQTGVEMEALTAVSVAALTVYDMVKAIDRGMTIEAIGLDAKSGGASGDWTRPDAG